MGAPTSLAKETSLQKLSLVIKLQLVRFSLMARNVNSACHELSDPDQRPGILKIPKGQEANEGDPNKLRVAERG